MSGVIQDVAAEAIGPDALPQQSIGNLLLRRLCPADYALLQPGLRRMPIRRGDPLAAKGAPISQVCFPEGGIVGLVEVLADQRRVAIGLSGREGLVGWPWLIGTDRWPYEVVARGPDATALAIDLPDLDRALAASRTLKPLLLGYASSFITQITSTLISNLVQSVEERTARWLLMYHDRIDGDEVVITHEELGAMLGVRRASITDTLHQLEGSGGVRSVRGRLIVRDREILARLAGDTYGRAEQQLAQALAPIGEDDQPREGAAR